MRTAWKTLERWKLVSILVAGECLLILRCAPAEVAPPTRDPIAAFGPEIAPEVSQASGPEARAVPEANHQAEPARSLMEFLGIGRGERVADLGAGAGYSVLRMAEAVGPSGVVYTRHDPRLLVAPAKPGAVTERAGTLPENIVVMFRRPK